MYRKATNFVYWFCILQIYWIFISPNSSIEKSYGFLYLISYHLQKETSVPYLDYFIFFCLIVLATTYSTMLNKSDRSGIFALFLMLKVVFSFSPLSMMLAVGWHHQLNGHGLGWTRGVGDGQGGLECWGLWGHKESDTTERLNWTEGAVGLVSWKPIPHVGVKSWGARCAVQTLLLREKLGIGILSQ